MNVKLVLIVLLVRDAVAAKGYITDGKVEKAVGKVDFLKTLHGYVGLLVKLLGDPARDAVQFNAVQLGFCHTFRHKTEKVAYAASGFQNIARLKAHVGKAGVHGLDDSGRCVMSI